MRDVTFKTLLCGSLLVGGCSVINSYDEVVPQKDTAGAAGLGTAGTSGAGGSSGSSGSAGTTAGSAGTTAGSGGTAGGSAGASGTAGAGAGGTAGVGGSSGTAGTAGTGGVPVPTKGLVVVGATDMLRTTGIVSVLAAADGKELKQETLLNGTQVAGIAYDGAAGKDAWFIFIASTFPATPSKVVDMQVRRFNDATNTWSTLSTATTLPAPIPGTFAVLNDRLAYLSHVVNAGTVVPSVTILDTSNLLNVKTVTYTPPVGTMVTLLGTRGTASDPSVTGGLIDIGLAQTCTAGACTLFVQPVAVGASMISDGVGHALGQYVGTPLAAAETQAQLDYFALAPPGSAVSVSQIKPDAPESPQTFPAPPSVSDLGSMTIDECAKVALFTATAENALYGVTLNGAGKTLDLGRQGQLIAYEPFNKQIISTYNPPMPASGMALPEIVAVTTTVNGTGTSLGLAKRAAFVAPNNLYVNTLTVRYPVPFTCP